MTPLAVIFDLDGTLIDSAPDIHAAAAHMLTGLGAEALPLETVIGFIGNGTAKLVERCLKASDLPSEGPEFTAAHAAFLSEYLQNSTRLTALYPGVAGLLDLLRDKGIRLGICTNKPMGPTRAILAGLEIDDRFHTVIGGDSLAVRKPDPAPLLRCISEMGITPGDALYVGDTSVDYATARAAKVRFVYFEGGYQRRDIPDFAPDLRVSHMGGIADILG